MDAMELIGLPGREVKVQSGKGKAITKADLPALSEHEVEKMLEGRQVVLDADIPASHADKVKILAMEPHGNLDGLSALCMEHCNKEIKEGFRKGSNHQPQRMLKCGTVTLSMVGQVLKRNTLMAHHRDMHGPAHRAQPYLPKNETRRSAGSTPRKVDVAGFKPP
eukprot:jgi/Tetstr1/466394/TSEL_010923.t1